MRVQGSCGIDWYIKVINEQVFETQQRRSLASFTSLAQVYSRLIVLPISARWHRWIGLSIETSAYKTVLKESFSDLTPGGGGRCPGTGWKNYSPGFVLMWAIFSKLFIIEGYCKLSRIIATSLRSWLMLQVCSSLYGNHKVYSPFIEIVLNL